tara:strand:+ start:3059 stop:4288 length:1230 start_codon:yes stop_codon:yes gene_type:complete
MAITLITQPLLTIPHAVMGKDKIVTKWSSNSADIVSCVIEVLVNSVRVGAFTVQPDIGTSGATSTYTFVLDEVLQTQLNFKLYSTVLSTYDIDNDSKKVFGVKIYEVTLNASTGLLETQYNPDDDNNVNSDASFSNRIVFNATIDTLNKPDYDVTDYQLTANSKRFLNDTPDIKTIELNQSEYLGALYYSGNPSESFKIEYLTYDSTDALLNTDYIDITDWDSSFGGVWNQSYITIPVGTSNLIAAGISLTNVAYYTVRIINNTGDVSELKRFNIVDACTQDVRIHWQNKYGKRDSYTLKGNKQEELEHEAITFMKATGITYTSEARGVSVMQNTVNSSFTAYSTTIGRDEYHWLSDMLINKRAFIEINNNYFPIIIEDGTFFKTDERNMPIQFVLNYKLANPTKGLRG